MKVFLDDVRIAPRGWIQARWPEDVIELLKTDNVTHVSLDHDLGDDAHGTGYDVILYIEEMVATNNFSPPIITVHSSNWSARQKMMSGISQIEKLTQQQESFNITEARSDEPAIVMTSVHALVTARIDARTDNILTRIRLIEGVSTVSQVTAIKQPDVMHRIVEVLIKFYSDTKTNEEYLGFLMTNIKAIKNVYSAQAEVADERTLASILARKHAITARRNVKSLTT